MGSAAQQVSQINAVTDAEKREKQIVLKKLAEMEEELKVRLRTINSLGAKTIKFQSLPVTSLNRFGNFYTLNKSTVGGQGGKWKKITISHFSCWLSLRISRTRCVKKQNEKNIQIKMKIFLFQTLDQLKADNARLRQENEALIRAMTGKHK